MDYSKSKYQNALAESLYGEQPDEEAGSVDGIGWAGLYREERAIILEDTQGFVWVEKSSSMRDLLESWEEVESDVGGFEYGLIV